MGNLERVEEMRDGNGMEWGMRIRIYKLEIDSGGGSDSSGGCERVVLLYSSLLISTLVSKPCADLSAIEFRHESSFRGCLIVLKVLLLL